VEYLAQDGQTGSVSLAIILSICIMLTALHFSVKGTYLVDSRVSVDYMSCDVVKLI
jgi:hypothetical protein